MALAMMRAAFAEPAVPVPRPSSESSASAVRSWRTSASLMTCAGAAEEAAGPLDDAAADAQPAQATRTRDAARRAVRSSRVIRMNERGEPATSPSTQREYRGVQGCATAPGRAGAWNMACFCGRRTIVTLATRLHAPTPDQLENCPFRRSD